MFNQILRKSYEFVIPKADEHSCYYCARQKVQDSVSERKNELYGSHSLDTPLLTVFLERSIELFIAETKKDYPTFDFDSIEFGENNLPLKDPQMSNIIHQINGYETRFPGASSVIWYYASKKLYPKLSFSINGFALVRGFLLFWFI